MSGTKKQERLEVVTPGGRRLGARPRDEVHAEGLWHEVFHAMLVRSGLPARVVLQRRQLGKAFPDKLDLSATGHLLEGEEPLDGVREIAEELGVEIDPAQLVPLGVRLLVDESGEGNNRERIHLYFVSDDRPLDCFAPALDEVSAVIEADVERLLKLLDGTVQAVEVTELRPGGAAEPITISVTDLVDPTSGYWTVLLVMAERFAAGQTPIAI